MLRQVEQYFGEREDDHFHQIQGIVSFAISKCKSVQCKIQ